MNDYRQGFRDGFTSGYEHCLVDQGKAPKFDVIVSEEEFRRKGGLPQRKGPKRKVKQTPKQKLLTKMAKAKWNKYKKGSGKKSYVEIRAQVSRSQEFKRKSKRLN